MQDSYDRVALIGPSGSGKSHLGSLLSRSLNLELVDVDAKIESRIGMPIDEFFRSFGEAAFRAIETEELAKACAGSGRVIATGGGAILAAENWAAMRPGTIIIGLTADVDTLVARVARQSQRLGRPAVRPNMAGDPEARMRQMLADRSRFYAQADVVIDTESVSIDEVHDQAVAAIQDVNNRGLFPQLSIDTPTERSDLYIKQGVRHHLSRLVQQRWPESNRLWILSDDQVAKHWMDDVSGPVRSSGFDVEEMIFPAGEASKSLDQLGSILDRMTANGVSRSDVVVALGGGVVGDLAGFVAAICLRGLALAQLPTSLLAMVDSSVGGKTAINTRAGKNMVGAFYQPGLVLIDSEFLSTLDRSEYQSGMAEVVKHGAIQASTPLATNNLAEMLGSLSSLNPIDPTVIDEVILENVSTKRSVVREDERESGLRMILNFGHTAGHAIEADGYRYRHGEAVALGMLVATNVAVALDFCAADRYFELDHMITRAGLPNRFDGDISSVLANMKSDKKNLGGTQRWILPVGSGGVEIKTGIDQQVVADAIAAIGGR